MREFGACVTMEKFNIFIQVISQRTQEFRNNIVYIGEIFDVPNYG